MATQHSSSPTVSAPVVRLPYFKLCERSGKYRANRALTSDQIIRAAKAALMTRVARGASFTSPTTVRDYLIFHYSERPSEAFICLFLDNKHRLIAAEDLFFGTIDGASVHPREVVRRSIELKAAAVIFAHNHPSGDTTPSAADLRITDRLKEALSFVDVRVLDHFIIGGGQAYSFANHGLI